MNIDLPKDTLIDNKGMGTREFANFLKKLRDCCQSPRPQSGNTANRPTRFLEVGLMYYDTDLGYPVFVHTVSPIVWHNAAGTVV